MDRLHSMARFDEGGLPLGPEPVGCCYRCGKPLYEGHEVVFYNRFDLYYCSFFCLRSDLLENMDDEIHMFVSLLIEFDMVETVVKTKEGVIR